MAKIQDALADTDVLDAGAGITITQAAPGDPVIITGTAAYTDEQVRDVIGTALVAGTDITVTVNDGADTITIASTASGGSGVGSISTAYKSADETVTSSTTLQNDDHLVIAIGASQTWAVHYVLFVSSTSAVGDFKASVAVPAGATVRNTAILGLDPAATSSVGDMKNQSISSATALAAGISINSNADNVIEFWAVVENSTTAGNITLQWAQNTSSASGSIVERGSYAQATRLA